MQGFTTRLVLTGFFVGVVGLLLPPQPEAQEVDCEDIETPALSVFVACPAGTPPPVGACQLTDAFCTEGSVPSGLLKGTFRLTSFDCLDAVGMSAFVPQEQISFSAKLVRDLADGTLTFLSVGIFNVRTWTFSNLDTVLEGTGRFNGATGFVHRIGGNAAQEGFDFAGTVTGEICIAKGPNGTLRPPQVRRDGVLPMLKTGP